MCSWTLLSMGPRPPNSSCSPEAGSVVEETDTSRHISTLYLFSIAAARICIKFSCLKKNTHLLSHSSQGQESKMYLTRLKLRCQQGHIPFWRLQGESVLVFPSWESAHFPDLWHPSISTASNGQLLMWTLEKTPTEQGCWWLTGLKF